MDEIKGGGIGRAGAEETGDTRPAPDNTDEATPEQAREGDTSAARPVEKRGEMLAFAAAIEEGLIKGRFENKEGNIELARELLGIRDVLIHANAKGFGVAVYNFCQQLQEEGISDSEQRAYQLFHPLVGSTLYESEWREKPFDITSGEETSGKTKGRFEKFIRELAGKKKPKPRGVPKTTRKKTAHKRDGPPLRGGPWY